MNIVEAIESRELLGALPLFRDLTSWRSWLAFLRAVYGLAMDETDLATFQKHTGRTRPREGGYAEAVCITGRQSGKSQIGAIIAGFEATLARDPGSYALLVSQDARAAQRVLFSYARQPFEIPIFAREITNETADTLELRSGATLACYPCRPAAIRGLRACAVVVDELAYFISTDGNPVDREMLRAIRPTVATTGGKLLVLSSPYGQAGAMWDLHRQHWGRDDSATLIWQASAPDMNPLLPADYVERMRQDDPEAYRSEVLGEFRAGLSTLLDPDALDACVIPGRRELPPSRELSYYAFVDPSGGRSDAFTMAIGHRTDDDRVIVDVARAWQAPFNPTNVVDEIAMVLSRYDVMEVVGDRYGGEWPREAFRGQGLEYLLADRPKSDLYVDFVAAVNSGLVELPDDPLLLRELRGLERRRGTSGRDKVDHRPGSHDDRANSVAGLVCACSAASSFDPHIS